MHKVGMQALSLSIIILSLSFVHSANYVVFLSAAFSMWFTAALAVSVFYVAV